jgi:hypothetical protein
LLPRAGGRTFSRMSTPPPGLSPQIQLDAAAGAVLLVAHP